MRQVDEVFSVDLDRSVPGQAWRAMDCLEFAWEAYEILQARGHSRDRIQVRMHPDTHDWLAHELHEEHAAAMGRFKLLGALMTVTDDEMPAGLLMVVEVVDGQG